MIDIFAFLKFLKRYIWVILIVSFLCVLITYFFVKNLPEQYKSQAQISTGIADRTQEILSSGSMDYFRITQQFNRLIEMIQTKRVINSLSINLILHDLENEKEAFREWPEEIQQLTPQQRNEVIKGYRERLSTGKSLSLLDNAEYAYYDYLTLMGYDEETLLDNLVISRRGESDIINIEFLSERPELSVFTVNTLSREFIYYYNLIVNVSEKNTMQLLDSILVDKQRQMDEKNALLRNYKSSSGVVNMDAQAEALYQQIAEYETKRSQVLSEIQALSGAIRQINEKLNNENNPELTVSPSADNNELLRVGRQLETANRRYIENNFSAADKNTVDSLENVRRQIIGRMSNRQQTDTRANRQNLIQERTTLEISLARAESSVASIENDLAALKGRYYTMAPAEANMQNLERDAELAVKDYTEALNRYNQANTENAARLRLQILEEGLPGMPEPSKKTLYMAGSGVLSMAISLFAFLVFFLLDNKIVNAKQLTERTGHKVVGNLSLVDDEDKDLRHIWQQENGDNLTYGIYKNLIRALRFEINKAMTENGHKVLGITSLSTGEGKTFIAASLAYAFALTNKKVLVIGDDCQDLASLISNQNQVGVNQFEKFLVKKEIKVEDLITVLNRNPDNTSILELRDSGNLIAGFDVLRSTFDIIIIDINSLQDINRAKEWLMFTDCSLAVFKSGSSLSEVDREQLKYLNQYPGFMGWVLNKVRINPKNPQN